MIDKPKVKKGDRIKLLDTDDPSVTGIIRDDLAKIQPWRKRGDMGTVSSISLAIDIWQIWIDWDDGSHFALLHGIDTFDVLQKENRNLR